MQIKVILSEHAQVRIRERGDKSVIVSEAIREASSQILSTGVAAGSRRVALEAPSLTTIPVVEISPRRYGVGLVVVTVLPRSLSKPIRHPVVFFAS